MSIFIFYKQRIW